MRTDPQIKVRLPPEIKAWLEREAARNLRSQNQEIVLALREKAERTSGLATVAASRCAGL